MHYCMIVDYLGIRNVAAKRLGRFYNKSSLYTGYSKMNMYTLAMAKNQHHAF